MHAFPKKKNYLKKKLDKVHQQLEMMEESSEGETFLADMCGFPQDGNPLIYVHLNSIKACKPSTEVRRD